MREFFIALQNAGDDGRYSQGVPLITKIRYEIPGHGAHWFAIHANHRNPGEVILSEWGSGARCSIMPGASPDDTAPELRETARACLDALVRLHGADRVSRTIARYSECDPLNPEPEEWES